MATAQAPVAIVTGAGGGIGRAVALRMAAAGTTVVVNDYGVSIEGEFPAPTAADQVVADVVAAGGEAWAHYGSVADHAEVRELVDRVVSQYGHLDALVTCHGNLRERMIFNMSEKEWDDVVDVHLKGTFNCVRFASAQMRKQGFGSMVLFTSAAGLMGNPGQANYAAAKAGIVGLASSTALAMGKYDVNINCISPSAATRMTSRLTRASTPANEIGDPDLIAGLADALTRPQARHVTGQVYAAAGRKLARWSCPQEVSSVVLGADWATGDILDAIDGPVGIGQLSRFAEFDLAVPGRTS